MPLSNGALVIVGGLFVIYALIAKRLNRTVITGPMLFTAVGLLLGPQGIDLVDLHLGDEAVETLLTTTLAIVLFVDATQIDIRSLRSEAATPLRLLLIGFPVMILLGFVAGWLVFPDLALIAVAAIAVVLAPTDGALGQAVVANPAVPRGIRQSLSVESGLNDGLALPALFTLLAIATAEGAAHPGRVLLREMGTEIGLGVTAGVLVGVLGVLAIRATQRLGLQPGSAAVGIAAIGIQVTTAGTALAVGGSILVAAFVAGLVVGPSLRAIGESVFVLGEDLTQVLTLLAFVVFGAVILSNQLGRLDWQVGLYAALSLLVVRPVSVAIAEIRGGRDLPSIAFMGWFGPRGLGSILFVFTIGRLAPTFDGLATVTTVMTWTVTFSILAHGLSAWPISNIYARYCREPTSSPDREPTAPG